VACVGGGGHEPGELVQPDAAADRLELAALLELVRQRDRVDRLVLAVELERGAVDLPVRLTVEVARVEDLADGRDRARRDHHRAENGLLGFEVLRRDGARGSRGRRDGGERHPLRFHQLARRVSRCWYVGFEQVIFGHLQAKRSGLQARRTAHLWTVRPLGAATSCAIHTSVDSV
jgi:hypothetical protein